MTLLDLTPGEDTLEPVETWPPERLRALQLQRLRWSLRHAWESVPQYRHAFEDARTHPDDIESLDDLRRLPLTSARDLRGPGVFAVPRARLARIQPGPVVTGQTARDLETWAAITARSLRAAGVQPGWAVLATAGFAAAAGGPALQAGALKHGCALIPAGDGDLARLVQTLEPQAILATAVEIATLPRAASSLCLAVLADPPNADLPSAGAWRETLEPMRGLHALGLHALFGAAIAQECVEAKDGPTLWEDHVFPEIVDPATGRPLADGQEGELVLTTLTQEAMPLLRYRTGDVARLLPGTVRGMRRVRLGARSM
jgi:phenylacetate-CoA ligase